MKLYVLFSREILLFRNNSLILAIVSVVCTVFLWLATTPETFMKYSDSLPVAFAMACASILIGLTLSINMVCKDYDMIRRELRMGITARSLIFAKTLLIVILCAIMSLILAIPYFISDFDIVEQNVMYLYVAVFFTMLSSAAVGLLASAFSRNRTQRAAHTIPFIMLFQILFSGFVFEQVRVEFLDMLTISRYSVRAIGSALRFDSDIYVWDTPYGAFENSISHAIENLGILAIFALISIAASIIVLFLIDRRGKISVSTK